ncbi:MAG: hypothetical protein AAGK74_14200, partial [Chloroflexota bacterium]
MRLPWNSQTNWHVCGSGWTSRRQQPGSAACAATYAGFERHRRRVTHRGVSLEPATQTLTVLVIIFVFALVAIASPIVGYARRRAVRRGIDTAAVSPLKPLSAYDLIPTLVAQSIEADRPILFSTGAGALGDGSTITTLAGTG